MCKAKNWAQQGWSKARHQCRRCLFWLRPQDRCRHGIRLVDGEVCLRKVEGVPSEKGV